MSAPKDQGVRDRFVTELDRNAVVEAGAGTGKTTLIVKRIAALVLGEQPVPLSRLAAITFTEAAATELRERVRDKLSEERRTRLDAGDTPGLARVDQAIAELDQALISTIHGFCQTILRENALSAGLDPSFEVIDANGSKRLIEEVFDLWFDEMGEHPAIRRALAFGIQPSTLEERARQLLQLGPAALDAQAFAPPSPRGADGVIRQFLQQAQAFLDQYGPHMAAVALDKPGRFYNQLGAVRDLLEAHAGLLADSADEAAWAAFELELMQPRFEGGKPGGGRADGRSFRDAMGGKTGAESKAIDADSDQLTQGFVAVREAIGQELLAAVQEPLLAFRRAYEVAKQRRAVVDFDDLLVRAEALVRREPAVRQRLFERVRTLFVDEFQDTDPVQARLVFYIAGGPGTEHEWDWQKIPPAPGRLVLMGDPKQSIYRFRKADVETYRRCCELVTAADPEARFVITTNFRTDGALVGFVNQVFSSGAAEMRAPDDGDYQADYIGLEAYHAERGAAVEVVALEQREEDAVYGSDKNVRLEAAAVVHELDGLLASWQLGWGDVAVLGRTHGALRPYAEALARAGVDFIYEGTRPLFEAREVREALTLMQALVDPEHQAAVVGTLRSVWFGVSDDALVRHKLAGGSWNPLDVAAGDAPGEPAALSALRQLGEWARATGDPVALVEALCFDGWMASLMRLRPNGAQAVMDLERFGGFLLELLDQGAASLAAAVRTCQLLARSGSDESAAQLEAANAVRLMTVHKSKGLEFGVVVLAQPAGQSRNGGESKPALDQDAVVWRLVKGFEHPRYGALRESEKPRDQAESLRVLYVALTRAKHRLVVPLFAPLDGRTKKPKELSARFAAGVFGQRLKTALFEALDDFAVERRVVERFDPDAITSAPPQAWEPALQTQLGELLAAPRPELERAARLAERTTRRPVPFGPSRVAEFVAAEHGAGLPQLETEGASGEPGDAGALAREVGTLVHLCIEERVAPDAARERASRLGLDAEQADFVGACVAAELELPSHARAFAQGAAVFDELPVSWGGAELAAEGGGPDLLMHAFIDRLIRHPDGSVEIVDFKTDRLEGPAETLEARLAAQAEHHLVQLALYGLALEAAGCHVTTLTLAFLAIGRDVSVAFDEARRDGARAALVAYQRQLV